MKIKTLRILYQLIAPKRLLKVLNPSSGMLSSEINALKTGYVLHMHLAWRGQKMI